MITSSTATTKLIGKSTNYLKIGKYRKYFRIVSPQSNQMVEKAVSYGRTLANKCGRSGRITRLPIPMKQGSRQVLSMAAKNIKVKA